MGVINWKTSEEIENEKNKPKQPSEEERVSSLENAILQLMMEQ